MKTKAKIEVLNESEMEQIKGFILKLLDEVGCWVEDPDALRLFKRHGYRVEKERVYSSPEQTMRFIHAYGKARHRNDEIPRGTLLKDQGAYIGVSDVHIFDWNLKQKRKGTLQDTAQAALVVNHLDYVGSMGMVVQPHEIHPQLRAIAAFVEGAKNTPKVGFASTDQLTPENAKYYLQMGYLVAGGKDRFLKEPLFGVGVDMLSPLKLPKFSSDRIQFGLENIGGVRISTCVLQGMTGMVTLASIVGQVFAETLFGGMYVELLEKERGCSRYNFRMNGNAFVAADMRTMREACGTIENSLAHIAMNQMEEYLGLPQSKYYYGVVHTESKIPDIQAGYEKMATCLFPLLAGLTWGHCLGELCTNDYFSLEQVIIDHEIVEMTRRAAYGVNVSGDALDIEVFKEGVAEGMFTGLKHTVDNFRRESFLPELGSRDFYAQWAQDRTSIEEKAHARIEEILKVARPAPKYEAPMLKDMENLLKNFERDLG